MPQKGKMSIIMNWFNSIRKWLIIMKWLIISIGIASAVIFCFIVFNKVYFNIGADIDTKLAASFGDFVGGFIGTLFTFLSILIVAYSILKQTCENRKNTVKATFFQMMDYHYKNLDQIEMPKPERKNVTEKGKRGFVAFKIQINRLLQALYEINERNNLGLNAHDVACIAYMVFYYGLSDSWSDFFEEKISCYDCRNTITRELLELSKRNPDMRLCQPNHTILSAYFRNMYNAIKMVDSENEFTDKEKEELIKTYRAQLSNPELYILFFNVISPFGKKWREKDFINKYKLLKNIPHNYLDGYDPKKYFKFTYESEEINCHTDNDEFPDDPPYKIKSSNIFQTEQSKIWVKWKAAIYSLLKNLL